MKQIICIAVVWVVTLPLYAQKDSVNYKHEVKASIGSITLLSQFEDIHSFSASYFYRLVKPLWIGVNFINYVGDKIYYNWREYGTDGRFEDFSKSKTKYCGVIAPEIRLSCLNKESIILYCALSGGIGWETGYNGKLKKYPKTVEYIQVTIFGLSCNLTKKKNIFFGGEAGIGYKGIFNIHGGYRF